MDIKNTADFSKAGVTLKQYVLGRRDPKVDAGKLFIGRYLALDKSTGSNIYIDAARPHVILICGKRGYGKSYTMGTLIEELASIEHEVNIAALVVDTMGIFWTMRHANKKEAHHLPNWNLAPQGFDVEVFVPAGNLKQYAEMNIDTKPFSISPSELSGYDWCSLFRVDPISPLGIILVKAIEDLKVTGTYSLKDIVDAISRYEEVDKNIRNAVQNYFRLAESWGIFNVKCITIFDIIHKGAISVLDLSSLNNQDIKAIVVKILGKKIYDESIKARRVYEKMEMGDSSGVKGIPMVWMFIDEAHIFLPRDGETPATSILVNEWLKQGRQPGLSAIFATQRPAALHSEVVSQADIIICHRLTAQDDISAIEKIRPTYMHEKIGDSLEEMGTERGVAFIVDDTTETTHVVQMRPRRSWHGGAEPSALAR